MIDYDDEDEDLFAGFSSEDYPDTRPPMKENPLLPKGEYEMVCEDIDNDPDKDYVKWKWEIVAGEHEGTELVFFERPRATHTDPDKQAIMRKIARERIAQMIRAVNGGDNATISSEADLLGVKVLVGLKHSKHHPDYPTRLEVSYITALIEEDAAPERKASVAKSAAKGAQTAAKTARKQQASSPAGRRRQAQAKRQAAPKQAPPPMSPPDDYDDEEFDDDIPF